MAWIKKLEESKNIENIHSSYKTSNKSSNKKMTINSIHEKSINIKGNHIQSIFASDSNLLQSF